MAPPLRLTRGSSSAMPSSRKDGDPWLAKASLSSITSNSVERHAGQPRHQLARRRHRADAHDARRERRRLHLPRTRATRRQAMFLHRGFFEAMIIAAAPSLTPEALPAVTVPSLLRNDVPSLASASRWSRADARPCR
jgi:hypothetical protein